MNPTVPDPDAIRLAADALRAGRLVAFPTETVYGLGANALDAAAVARVFAAKGRPAVNPFVDGPKPMWIWGADDNTRYVLTKEFDGGSMAGPPIAFDVNVQPGQTITYHADIR